MNFGTRDNILNALRGSRLSKLAPDLIKNYLRAWLTKPNSDLISRACHCNELFIKSIGDVFPCCRVWYRSDMKIGHVTDKNIIDKITDFIPPNCSCNKFTIKAKTISDPLDYTLLNLELSLACQATCAMCCVNAPEWCGTYDLYNDIKNMIKKMGKIDTIISQGGEVLAQKESLNFLSSIKKMLPVETRFGVISNANFDVARITEVEELFDNIDISIVGFQPETYSKIMGLKLDKTIRFAEELITRGNIHVSLKFLITPLTFHEQAAFLKWALKLAPNSIVIYDSRFSMYINKNTADNFWDKIISRTIVDVKNELRGCDISKLRVKGTRIYIHDLPLYRIDSDFIAEAGLAGIIKENDT